MQLEHYNTIDKLPIKIWFSVLESNDYSKIMTKYEDIVSLIRGLETEINIIIQNKRVDKKKLQSKKILLDSYINYYNNLSSSWEKMFDEWISKFGFSDNYNEYFNQKIKIAKLKADFIITGERYLKTLIRVEQEILKADQSVDEKPFNLDSILWKMTKFYGARIRSNELTVSEYYSAINEISDGK